MRRFGEILLIGLLLCALLGAAQADEQPSTLPAQLEEIGAEAFFGDTSLDQVYLQPGLKRIGERAFADSSVRWINLPDSLEFIDDTAFTGSKLTVNMVSATEGTYAWDWAVAKGYIEVPGAYSPIGNFEYDIEDGQCEITSYLGEEETVRIPPYISGAPVTSIGSESFFLRMDVEEVVIPEGVTSIGKDAFTLCLSMTSVKLPEALTTIGQGAFESCTSLSEIRIPAAVTRIGANAFATCESMTGFDVAEANESYASVDGVLFDKALTTLMAYPACREGTSYTVPETVTEVSPSAFGESPLEEIKLPKGLKAIGYMAFYKTDIPSIDIPEGVETIGDQAFMGCANLTEVTFPASAESIGYRMFEDCESFTAIHVAAGNENYREIDGVLFDADGTTLLAYPPAKPDDVYTIPNGVETIYSFAFDSCDGFTQVNIPDSVKKLEHGAFFDCDGLTSVDIPGSVKLIDERNFSGCKSLTRVVIGEGVESIGWDAFTDCHTLTRVVIPASVKTFGEDAFLRCANELVIYGEAGSPAETYAREAGLTFDLLENLDDTEAVLESKHPLRQGL